MYEAYADKLLNFTEQHATEIGTQWAKALQSSTRTKSYRKVREFKLVNQGELFFKNMKKLFFDQNVYDVTTAYFTKFAEDQFYENIPLEEAIYALIMLRRQMWLFAEFHVLFSSSLDQYQAAESINRTVLVTDYGMMAIIKKYAEMTKK
jgi:hypothetical protein